jgi:hypothetical protein
MSIMPIGRVVDNSFKIVEGIRKNFLDVENTNLYKMHKNQDLVSFKKEFATVKISLPRRQGNTALAFKCLKDFKCSILVFRVRADCDDPRVKEFDRKRIFTLNMSSLKSAKADVIIVDGASYIEKEKINKIYDVDAQFYVLLG